MTKDTKRKGQNKLAFPLGLAIIIFAIIGVIFAVGSGINAVKDLTDNSEKKLKYETMLIPVVMYDPDMFDDVSAANINNTYIVCNFRFPRRATKNKRQPATTGNRICNSNKISLPIVCLLCYENICKPCSIALIIG